MRRPRRAAILTAARCLAGFLLAAAFSMAFSDSYERLLAGAGEAILRAVERPAVTRLSARDGEILVERGDFPPAAPRPGLPAVDLDFNFALLAALFALDRRPWQAGRAAAFLAGCGFLFAVHVGALVLEVESLYATELGAWSGAHYGAFARNFWSAAFHFYLVAGRFAAPFAIWWFFRRPDPSTAETGSWLRNRRRGRA